MSSPTKVFCIEDDRDSADLIREDLTDRGYVVKVAYDFSTALATLASFMPDVILCDVNVPGMSGFEFLESARGIVQGERKIPFIFLTGNADKASIMRGHSTGADEYMLKPVDFDVLDAVIRKYTVHDQPDDGAPLPFGLSRREAEVLQWSARGKTSAEIAIILDLGKRTVDFHIDNAREKLNVATRTEAVVRAALLNIIQL